MHTSTHSPIPRSLFLGMVLQYAVGGAVTPFITIFFRDRGLDYAQISHIFLLSSALLLFVPFFWGMMADRFVALNRLFALINLVIAVALFLLRQSETLPGVLASYLLFHACLQPALILMNALAFHHLVKPAEQYAQIRTFGSIGWILPSLPIYLWLAFSRSERFEFFLLLGIGISAAMAAASFLLPYTPPARGRASHPDAIGYGPAVRKLARNADYLVLLISHFLVSASFTLLTFYSPPFLEEHGLARAWIGPVQCIGVLMEILLFPSLSFYFRRFGFAQTILIGASALALRQGLFAWSNSLAILSLSYILAGMTIVFFHSGVSILVNALATSEVRATAQTGLLLVGAGIGPMFANWAAGVIAARSANDLRPVFLLAACLAFAAAALVFLRRSHFDGRSHPPASS